jgi:hypothetical protein
MIFCWILVRMRSFSEVICGKNQNTRFVFDFFRKSYLLWDNLEKIWYSQTSYRWHNTAHAPFNLDTYSYKHTLRICHIHCFSTAKVVMRTRLDITLLRTFAYLVVLCGVERVEWRLTVLYQVGWSWKYCLINFRVKLLTITYGVVHGNGLHVVRGHNMFWIHCHGLRRAVVRRDAMFITESLYS